MPEFLNAQEAQSIFESCPLPAVVLDDEGLIMGVNNAFADMIGSLHPENLSGIQISSIANPALRQLLNSHPQLDWEDDTGKVRKIFIERVTLAENSTKEIRFFIDRSEHVRLESANTALEDKLQQNLLTDPVTGLLNQRGIVLALEPQIARCRRYNSTLSVVVMAVDGPVERDKLLIKISHLLKDQLRWADLVGCTDEQEFMLALPETPESAAMQLAEKLKPLLEDISKTSLDGVSIWSCFGIAGWRKNDNAPSLIQRASCALAKARNSDSGESVAL